MVKYKVFIPNVNKKVEFTKEELEKLLNEVYNEGYTDGKASNWTVSYGFNTITQPYEKITCTDNGIQSISDNITCKTANTSGTISNFEVSPSNTVAINKITN